MTGLRVTCLAPGALDDLAGALAAAKLATTASRATGRVSAGLHDAGAFGVNIFRTGYEFESAERHAA